MAEVDWIDTVVTLETVGEHQETFLAVLHHVTDLHVSMRKIARANQDFLCIQNERTATDRFSRIRLLDQAIYAHGRITRPELRKWMLCSGLLCHNLYAETKVLIKTIKRTPIETLPLVAVLGNVCQL